jgi:hypothetical protein
MSTWGMNHSFVMENQLTMAAMVAGNVMISSRGDQLIPLHRRNLLQSIASEIP